jgi:hypothetical protein
MRVATARPLVSDWSRNKARTGRVSRDWALRTKGDYLERPLAAHGARESLGEVVYAIRTPDGLIKIGSTTHLGRRLINLKSQFGEHEFLCFQPGSLADEKAIHIRWRKYRAHGKEWYHPAPEILDWINENRQALGRDPVAA